MQNDTQYIQQDTINTKELFTVLERRKTMIWGVTSFLTLLTLIYVFVAKPIYQGQVLIEIGEVVNNKNIYNETINNEILNNNQQKTIILLDNVDNLKNIVIQAQKTNASVPKNTNNLLMLTYDHPNTEKIKIHLQTTIDYILQRHREKAKLYEDTSSQLRMTQTVGNIAISDQPIKPMKTLIVALGFITSLMLSVFLAFFLEFLKGIKQEEKEV